MKKNKPFPEYTYQELFDYNSSISRTELQNNSMPIELERDMIEQQIKQLMSLPKSRARDQQIEKLNQRDIFLETLLIEAYQS